MPLAPGLLLRTLIRPGGRVVSVVVRRRATAAPSRRLPGRSAEAAQEKPYRGYPVPACDIVVTEGFSAPIARALRVLGRRALPVGRDGIALDGRLVPLIRMVAEANRCLAAAGRSPIAYPGLREMRR